MNFQDCDRCRLSKSRTQVVLGSGDLKSDLMFIGEAPGRDENLRGKPFVGAAGRYLDELLNSIGLKRANVYITNIIKCWPPDNRDPFDDEMNACADWLAEEIRLIRPKVIVTLGRYSTSLFLPKSKISEIHGTINQIGKLIVFPSYHPAAALYNGRMRKVIEDDFAKLRTLL